MGYTPLFDTLLNGTMFGKWPHNGIWALLLTRATREGEINEVPESLAAHIGIPVEQLMASIEFFMAPDPGSRTETNDGRRLELIDPRRPWGWRIINHGKYREKARKASHDSERVASGQNAERMKARRAAEVGDPTRPDETRRDPLSEAYADKREREPKPPPKKRKAKSPKTPLPDDFVLDHELRDYAIAHLPSVHVDEMFTGFCGKAKAKGWIYADWRQAWQEFVRNSAPNSGHWAAGQYPKNAMENGRWM